MLKLSKICVRDTLKCLDLSVAAGERILVVGGNGAGKSTLFGVISGRINPDHGSVVVDGMDMTIVSECKRTYIISSILQDMKAGMVEEMTILENMKLAYMRTGGRKVSKGDIDIFKAKLSIFGMDLENKSHEYARNLSGGEKQALSIVMATSADYKLLLLDEVTSALSQKVSDLVMSSIDEITSMERKTCLMITHDTRYMHSFGNRTLEMKDGVLCGALRSS
ncbi:MAG: ATP-binding cassette domain-containing protein [Holosporales bacterium]|jgi:putative ABC transport system ATP-binding protein|nr:ATP-binding cassette domain-containing protein [Holosporales bacterium]